MKEPLHLSVSQEEFETGPGRIQFRIVVHNQGTEDESLFFRVTNILLADENSVSSNTYNMLP